MKRAVIVGCNGQDGRILFDRLLEEGYCVLGIGSQSIRCTEDYPNASIDITDRGITFDLIRDWCPEEVYYLAAYHHSSQDQFDQDLAGLYEKSHSVHVRGVLNFLEAIRTFAPQCRLFYAASSLVFGEPTISPQNEETPLSPACIYGITKAAGIQCCRVFRQKHGTFAVSGILYNHESVYRQPKFVSQKIIRGAIAIHQGHAQELVLGSLSAEVDWGYAPDYVDAMVRTLAAPTASDYVIATGELHTIKEFVVTTFEELGLDWTKHVREDASVITRRLPSRVGDASKLRAVTKWKPTIGFREMISLLLKEQLRASQH